MLHRTWGGLQSMVGDFLLHGWTVTLHPKMIVGPKSTDHNITLQAIRGEEPWLLEVSRSEGLLTDDIILALPPADTFIRLDSTGDELYMLLIKNETAIGDFWESNTNRSRYGPEGLPEPFAQPLIQLPEEPPSRWETLAPLLASLASEGAAVRRPGAIEGGLWTVVCMNGTRPAHAGFRHRDEVMEYAWKIVNNAGTVLQILRPDGEVEIEGDLLLKAIMAYDAKRPKS